MKLAVVSGGSRGLGAALCRRYLDQGYQALEFSRSAPHAHSVRVDFSDPLEAEGIVGRELSRLRALDFEEIVVVSNAGTLHPIGPASGKDPAVIAANVAVNVTSAVLFISRAIREFQARACRKTVVHITSGAALRPYSGWSLYCLAKAGMETFIRTLALEQDTQPHPFKAISIEPGIVDTDMQAAIRNAGEEDFPELQRFLDLKRSGALKPPEEVAEAILRIVRQNSGNGLRYSVRDFPR